MLSICIDKTKEYFLCTSSHFHNFEREMCARLIVSIIGGIIFKIRDQNNMCTLRVIFNREKCMYILKQSKVSLLTARMLLAHIKYFCFLFISLRNYQGAFQFRLIEGHLVGQRQRKVKRNFLFAKCHRLHVIEKK